jgi:hypothetical protein
LNFSQESHKFCFCALFGFVLPRKRDAKVEEVSPRYRTYTVRIRRGGFVPDQLRNSRCFGFYCGAEGGRVTVFAKLPPDGPVVKFNGLFYAPIERAPFVVN